MRTRDYVDLDLAIEQDGDGYIARIVDSPAGQATRRFVLPFDSVALENFILKLGHNRGRTRAGRSPRLELAKDFGDHLYRTVFDDEIEIAFRSSLRDALATEKGLRVRLRLDRAPALAEIPWEYMYSEGLGRFLVMSSDTPLVRYLDVPAAGTPLPVQPPLRVLVMVSSPRDLLQIDVDRELEFLRQATSDLTEAGALHLEVAPQADLHTLLRMLRTSEFHIFHFVGHGVFDEREDDGLIMLVNEQGTSRPVSGLELGVILHDHHSLRLAVLNACEGARGSVENPLGGVAQTLIRQGLPAAVAMQFEISEEAALVFAHEFYMAIADGYPIDAATVEARKAIFASGNDVEWGTPVLHLRSSDARVFDLKERKSLVPDDLRERAITALQERRFAEAVALLEQVVETSPNDQGAIQMLPQARAQLEAEQLYDEAETALQQGHLDEAVSRLARVGELDPLLGDPRDIAGRAQELERQQKAEQANRRQAAADGEVARARAALEAGELHEARRILAEVLVASPGHTAATAAQSEVHRRLQARHLIDEARVAFEAGDWEQVIALVENAQDFDPQLDDEDGLRREASLRLSLPPGRPDVSVESPDLAAPSPPPAVESPPERVEPPAASKGGSRTLPWAIAALAALGAIVWVVVNLMGDDPETPPESTGADTTTALPEGTIAIFPVEGLNVDGDPSDWPDLEAVVSDRVVASRRGNEPLVGASWLLGWDDHALYFLARAEDDSVDPGPLDNPSGLFRGDSVHFEIGPDPEGARGLRSEDKHVILGPGDRSGTIVVAINVPRGGVFVPGPSGDDAPVLAAGSGNGEGYVVEAAIAWENLGIEPAPGLVIGLNVNISDGDGAGELEQMVSSNPNRTADGQNAPAVWHRAVLR